MFVDPVDDFGTATRIEERVLKDEVELVRVYSDGISRLLKLEGMSSEQLANLEEQTVRSVDEALLKDLPSELCLGVLCESDTGLRLAEELGSAILPRLYNSRSSRRDKRVEKTVDLRTAAGYALLVSQSLDEISEDTNNLVAFQKEWLVVN